MQGETLSTAGWGREGWEGKEQHRAPPRKCSSGGGGPPSRSASRCRAASPALCHFTIKHVKSVPLTLLMFPWAPAPQKHQTAQICTSTEARQLFSLICFIPQPEELCTLGESNSTFWIINRKKKKKSFLSFIRMNNSCCFTAYGEGAS